LTRLAFVIKIRSGSYGYQQNRRQAMNRAELVSEVSVKKGLSKKGSHNVIDVLTETIGDTLAQGEKVTLVGFGTFQVARRML